MTTIGRTDLTISPITLGANSFGWTSDEPTSHAVIDAFVEGGGTSIDTSDSYGAGASESILGGWLAAGGHRERVFVATKVGQNPQRKGLAADTVKAAADESLQRLRTDHVDLLWAHYDDADVPLAETLGALQELVDAGKATDVAISNYSPARIREWLDVAQQNGFRAPVALQPQYSLIRRHEFEDERRDLAEQHGLAVLPYWGLASGLLTGKFSSSADWAGTSRAGILDGYASPEAFAVVDVLREVATAHDAEPSTVALAWLRSRPGVTSPIASVSRVDQLPSLLAVGDLVLTDDETARLTAASDAVGQ